MSKWTDIRDKLEAAIEPAIQKGLNFLHAIETLAEDEALGDAEAAAAAGAAAAEAATGGVKDKAIAALEAFGSVLLGDAIVIVKKAAASAETAS